LIEKTYAYKRLKPLSHSGNRQLALHRLSFETKTCTNDNRLPGADHCGLSPGYWEWIQYL